MSAPFFLTVSAAFLLVAMMFFRTQRASLIRDIAFGGLLAVSILLYAAHAVADSFTDAGINQAVWFHFRYGLRGAGFGAYSTLIAAATAGLAGVLALCFAVSFWRRSSAGAQPAWGIMPLGLLLVSGAFNPAIHDLAHLRPTAGAAGSDFHEYCRTPYIKPTGAAVRNLVFVFQFRC